MERLTPALIAHDSKKDDMISTAPGPRRSQRPTSDQSCHCRGGLASYC